MNKTVKRFLVSGVALAMLATTGTGIVSNNTNVNASSRSRISKLESQKRYYSNKLSNINKELARLTHQNKRIKRTKRTKRVRKARTHHEAAYMWYYHNGNRLYKRYINTNKMFRKGYHNGPEYLDTDNMNNNKYRQGWIISMANFNRNGSKRDYKQAISVYNQGLIYSKNNPSHSELYYSNENGQWNNYN